MKVVLIIVALSVFHTVGHIFCLIKGINIGQKLTRGEEVSIPNPVTALKEYQDEIEQKDEEIKVRTMLENIDIYDGTGLGQKDIGW